ncbi:FadR/GntR family transcriptional regulator [Demequina lutea]|uniref:GntR family transcriptional repressor for pyruvate dehydrogenase complex n=1 Tax=Demequina lutea TaxID=431489 RepID=A0A7Y9ZA67_9MICO|nr:FCD domain-containing protein [Demequina lutea]NYI40508.1 GntR family transcriptional repressor for pyruvate dehydrogenase complex [Demequina lutea]
MITRSKLRDAVVSALLERIDSDGLMPGDTLPPEREIAAELGVSRTVVREGLAALEIQGVLELVAGRRPTVVHDFERAFASTLGHAVASDAGRLRELTEMRTIVEPAAADLAAQRATPTDIDAMRRSIDAMRSNLDRPEGFVDADIAFHEALLSAAGNGLLADMMRPSAALLALSRRRSSGVRRPPADALSEHEMIFDAIGRGDRRAARAACAQHLDATLLDLEASNHETWPS